MAIRSTVVDPSGGRNINFPKSALAFNYCFGEGLEIGSGSHNSFGLKGSRNVSPGDAETLTFRDAEVEMCGSYDEIDIQAEGDDIPVDNESQNYVISSHVFEHFADPIKALMEWYRIVKHDGIIFIIAPKRDAHAPDQSRPISTLDEIKLAHFEQWAVDTVPVDVMEAAGGRRGHTFVWTIELARELVEYMYAECGFDVDVVKALHTDDKPGNGWCLILRVHHE